MSGSPPHTPLLSGSLPCTPTRSHSIAEPINTLTSNTSSDSPSLSALASLTSGARGASSRHRHTNHYGSTWQPKNGTRGRRQGHRRDGTWEEVKEMDDHDEGKANVNRVGTCASFMTHLAQLCLPLERLGNLSASPTSKPSYTSKAIHGVSCTGNTSPISTSTSSTSSSCSCSCSEDEDDEDDPRMEQIRDDLGRIVRLGSLVLQNPTNPERFPGGGGQRQRRLS